VARFVEAVESLLEAGRIETKQAEPVDPDSASL
jgi:hypothetical protein